MQRLQGVLSKAVEWKVHERHPFAGLKPLKVDRTGRVRYLSEEEEARLREALLEREESLRPARIRFNAWRTVRGRPMLPLRTSEYIDHLQPVVLLALNTGLRRSELFHLRWKDVDLTGQWLCGDGATAKDGQTRPVPRNTEALTTLEGWRKQTSDVEPRVFPGVGGQRLLSVAKIMQCSTKERGKVTTHARTLPLHWMSA